MINVHMEYSLSKYTQEFQAILKRVDTEEEPSDCV